MKNEHTEPQPEIQYSIWNTRTNEQSSLKEKTFLSMEKPLNHSETPETSEEPLS